MRLRRGRALAAIAWLPLLLGALLLYIGLVVHHRALLTFINGEDCLWIRGDDFGWTDRTVQRYLLQQLFPTRLGPHLEPLYIFAVGLHLLIALQLYALFVRLPAALGSTLDRTTVHLAGATAGLLYVLFHSTNLGYLSALSYQLCTLLLLAGLTLTLSYLRRPRLYLWLLLAGVFWLGLNTHPFMISLPLLMALLELNHHRTGGSGAPPRWRSVALRHGLLLVILGGHLLTNLDTLISQWERRPPPPRFTLLSEPAHIYSFFAAPLEFYLQRFAATNLPSLNNPRVLATSLPGALAMLAPLALIVLLVVTGVISARRHRRRQPVGLAGAAFFLLAAWNLLIYLQVRLAPMMGEPSWRYELTVAGYCLLATLAALVLAGRLVALIRSELPPGWVGALLLVPLAGFALVASSADQRDLAGVILRGEPLDNSGSCQLARWCPAFKRLTRFELLSNQGSLACVDLSGLDLKGMDLRGRDLGGANLSGARLQGARLDRADLKGACLNWSHLKGASLQGADLREARLVGAVLTDTNLCAARINGVYDACASELVVESVKRRCP